MSASTQTQDNPMALRDYASCAKLPYSAIEELRDIKNADRDTFASYAERHGVHLETVRRAYKGLTWKRPLTKMLDTEERECAVCHAKFSRRRGKRLMTMRLWKDKITCSCQCLYKLKKERGHDHPFDREGATVFIPLHTIIEADGHMRQDRDEGLASRSPGDQEAT